jgi:hypothetical protein
MLLLHLSSTCHCAPPCQVEPIAATLLALWRLGHRYRQACRVKGRVGCQPLEPCVHPVHKVHTSVLPRAFHYQWRQEDPSVVTLCRVQLPLFPPAV